MSAMIRLAEGEWLQPEIDQREEEGGPSGHRDIFLSLGQNQYGLKACA